MEIDKDLEEHFKSQQVRITIFPDKEELHFVSLEHFIDVMKNELSFWSSCNSGNIAGIRNHFQNIVNQLTQALQPNRDAGSARHDLQHAIDNARKNSFPAVYSATPTAQFLKTIYGKSQQHADAACEYLFENRIGNIQDKNKFQGYLMAFLYKGDDKSTGVSAEKNEYKALEELRSRYVQELNLLHADYLKRTDDIGGSYASFQENLTNWKNETQKALDKLIKDRSENLDKLERNYHEKLRLEGPAQYWSNMAKEYFDKGKMWRTWAITGAGLLILLLMSILYQLPNGYMGSKGLSLDSLKMTILLALIASIGVYIVRLFTRLSTSAFHLSRDAKERHQLTHVYLSLLHEKGVTDADRHIVLQSIFSRADTGLLKGDSSPTLPDNIVSQILKNMSKK
ncbi:MAG: DUF6161 domain-containing protein [Nitrospirota bacterium]|nr:DUF6161 domain-containing protein [Nitrospirota bacterium]